jgi:hypothetical protein
VVPSALERWLVDAIVPGGGPGRVAALTAAEQGGLLTVSTRRISFRHELTRRAIAGSLPSARLIALNQRVLAVLAGRDGPDVAQNVHHAAQAGDVDAIAIRPGRRTTRPVLVRTARLSRISAWCLSTLTGSPRGKSRAEQFAIECYTIGAAERAAAQRQAVEPDPGWATCACSASTCGGCPDVGLTGNRKDAERVYPRGGRGA